MLKYCGDQDIEKVLTRVCFLFREAVIVCTKVVLDS